MTVETDDAEAFLRSLGERGSDPLDIAEAALRLSGLDHRGTSLARYRAHLAEIAEHARGDTRHASDVEGAARALAGLMAGRFGYDGERIRYDDPLNADLITVIDRRRGLPVALGVLYLHAARAAGFEAQGLHSPGHFLLRIAGPSGEALIDPFNGGAAVERESLGAPPALVAASHGEMRAASLISDIDVLLRLLNNIKVRAAQRGDRSRALELAQRMVLLGPRRADLWIEIGRLQENAGALGAASKAYETALRLAPHGQPQHNEAALALQSLKRRLN
jgi:regulator of sirC expression with transglutaminase-like and TPR domain